MPARAYFVALAALAACARAAPSDVTDEEFYQMPRLFQLDPFEECAAARGVYCVGSFELAPDRPSHRLFQLMQRYSADEVAHFNHTRLHRALCVSRRCAALEQSPPDDALPAWFTSCVNASTHAQFGLSARALGAAECSRGRPPLPSPSAAARAFVATLAALLALAALSTLLDLTLADHTKKKARWAQSWSVAGGWQVLTAPPPPGPLRALDGLRVLGMLCFIVEHVCWLNTRAYIADTRTLEQMRYDTDAMLVTNSTLLVQAFFLMSSFLLASKLLRQEDLRVLPTVGDTLLNRFIRMTPAYMFVVWFAGTWWARLGAAGGPWAPLLRAEAAVCRRKWWAHLLYLHNLLYPDDKCLIQTWYLAADMQLYVASLALTLALRRCRRPLAALLGVSAAALLALATLCLYYRLLPAALLHQPEAVRAQYAGSASFNWVYQAPLGNAAGALAGLLLAHANHRLQRTGAVPRLARNQWFVWSVRAAPWAAVGWVAAGGRLAVQAGAAAALAAAERAVFSALVALALLGALCGVQSHVRSVLSWRGWALPARLSYGALLLHMPLHQALLAARATPASFDRGTVVMEWFGVAVASYLAALPLALLVELPALRLYRALRGAGTGTDTGPGTGAATGTHTAIDTIKTDAPAS